MEKRIARLEARMEALEKQVAELGKAAGLAPKEKKAPALGGEDKAFLDACSQAASGGKRVRIRDLRQVLGWESRQFDDVLDRLAKGGHVALHQGGGMGLSLKQMEEAFLGDGGETYTELSLP